MDEAVTHDFFEAGAPVPDWLLDCEPKKPGSPRPSITFVGDTDVFGTPERYVCVPREGNPGGVIVVTGNGPKEGLISVFAPAKPVLIAISWSVFTPGGWDDDDGDGEDAPVSPKDLLTA